MGIFSNKKSIGRSSAQKGLGGKENNSLIGESKKTKKRGKNEQAPSVKGLKSGKGAGSFAPADKKQKRGAILQDGSDEQGYQEITEILTDQDVSQDEANDLWEKQEALRMQLEDNEEEIAEVLPHVSEGGEMTSHAQEAEEHLDDLLDERESLEGRLKEIQARPVPIRGAKIGQKSLMKRKITPSSSRRRRI